jgi:hypothetical protein
MVTIPYVYRLTDRQTGIRYIGSRFAKGCSPDDLGVSYFTSSKRVAPLMKSDPARFDKQIIATGDADFVIRVEHSLLKFYDAAASEKFYNRAVGKAIHPDDIRAGALKEHAKRSPELYRLIAKKMHAKTTKEHRSRLAYQMIANLGQDGLAQKMAMMRASRDPERVAAALKRTQAALTKEHFSTMGSKGGKIGGPRACKVTNAQRWKCVVCGMVSSPGPIGKHQSRSGHQGKERLQ